jgi:cell division protein FtsL
LARLNFVLIAIVLASALGAVASQHKARKLFTELEREQERMRSLEVEWGQLQLEQSTWAAHVRIEKSPAKSCA